MTEKVYLESIWGQISTEIWWWAYWFIGCSVETLNKYIREAQLYGCRRKVELFCATLALKEIAWTKS